MSLLTSLVAHWKLNEASGARLDSHGTHHLTDINTVGSAAGKLGNAAQFVRASSERLEVNDHADLRHVPGWSIVAWVYLDSGGAEQTIAAKSSEWFLRLESSRIPRFFWTDGGGTLRNVISGFGALSLGTWYMLTARHDATTNQIEIAVNNGAFSTAAATGATAGTALMSLGARASNLHLDGRLDAVSIYQRCITNAERDQHYNSGNGLDYTGFSGEVEIAPNSAYHEHTASSPTVTPVHVIAPDSAYHLQVAGEPGVEAVTYAAPTTFTTLRGFHGANRNLRASDGATSLKGLEGATRTLKGRPA